MAIKRELMEKKLEFLYDLLRKIENMEFDEDGLKRDIDIQDLLTFRFQQAVETCIDIATHLIIGLSLKRQETAKDAFLLLGEEGIISKDLSLKMGKAADFRNRVVHGYNNFDFSILFKDYKDDLNDLHRFSQDIFRFLEKGRN